MTPPPRRRLLEICLDDIGGAEAAARAGADRVEICSRLDVGGLTPGTDLVADALSAVSGPPLGLRFLIRCRAGNFVHSRGEVALMGEQIRVIRHVAHAAGALRRVGFVVGTLTGDGLVDRAALETYARAADGAPLTVHKAFDEVDDRTTALESLIDAGVERVLTSGGAATAMEGADDIRSLVAAADGRITILAGGGVRPDNLLVLLSRTGVDEVHLRAQDQDRRTDPSLVGRVRALLDGHGSRGHRAGEAGQAAP